jgi:hypothetical protein
MDSSRRKAAFSSQIRVLVEAIPVPLQGVCCCLEPSVSSGEQMWKRENDDHDTLELRFNQQAKTRPSKRRYTLAGEVASCEVEER